jgi:hypothetical protein
MNWTDSTCRWLPANPLLFFHVDGNPGEVSRWKIATLNLGEWYTAALGSVPLDVENRDGRSAGS